MEENANMADAGENEIDVGAITENLLTENAEQEPEQQAEEPSAEEARKAEMSDGLHKLYDVGWTVEELEAFSQDAQAREDIQKNGKTILQAARAYERRLRTADKAEAKPAKRGVPTMRTASNSGASGHDQIAEMSDKEFDAFYKQAMSDSLAGKKRRL